VTEGDLGGKKFALGRPWRDHARVFFIGTELSPSVDPGGWNDWGRDPVHVDFAEAGNSGPGANPNKRVKWSRQLDQNDAAAYMPGVFLAGDDHWKPETKRINYPDITACRSSPSRFGLHMACMVYRAPDHVPRSRRIAIDTLIDPKGLKSGVAAQDSWSKAPVACRLQTGHRMCPGIAGQGDRSEMSV
jgi:hypothetical protein